MIFKIFFSYFPINFCRQNFIFFYIWLLFCHCCKSFAMSIFSFTSIRTIIVYTHGKIFININIKNSILINFLTQLGAKIILTYIYLNLFIITITLNYLLRLLNHLSLLNYLLSLLSLRLLFLIFILTFFRRCFL